MIGGAVSMLTVLALSGALAAPSILGQDDSISNHKRSALVLDRLLVALQNALRDDSDVGGPRFQRHIDREGPRAAPLRIGPIDTDMSALQRRGQTGPSRGRVLRCYFNAITCF